MAGLVLFRWDAPLFFANAELFRERVLAAVAESPTPVRSIVVAAAPVTSIDVTAADTLSELDQALQATGDVSRARAEHAPRNEPSDAVQGGSLARGESCPHASAQPRRTCP